jgi:hypothetical protein
MSRKRKAKAGRPSGGYRSSRERERRLAQAATTQADTDQALAAHEEATSRASLGDAGVEGEVAVPAAEVARAAEVDEPAKVGDSAEADEPVGADDAAPGRGRRAGVASRGSGLERRGLFSGLRASSPFPRLGRTLAAGLAAVFGSPALALGPLVLVFLIWLALLAIGLDHVPQGMADLLAIPPVGSFLDVNIPVTMFGLTSGGLVTTFAFTIVRGLLWSLIVSVVVESLEYGRASLYGLLRGVRAAPTVIAIVFANLGVIFLTQLFAPVLGPSLGQTVFLFGFVGGLYALVFAPVAVMRAQVSPREALRRSFRVATFPGARHLGLVFMYFFIAFWVFLSLQHGGAFSINPSVGLWAVVLCGTLLHLVFMAAFAYRYMQVEDQIPPPAPRDRRRGRLRAR